MKPCAVHECEHEATEPFVVLGRKRILGRGRRAEVKANICDEHAAAAAADGNSCVFADPPGTLWIVDRAGGRV